MWTYVECVVQFASFPVDDALLMIPLESKYYKHKHKVCIKFLINAHCTDH